MKYDLKRVVNHKYVENIKQCKYSDIMQMKISPKNKLFNEDNNKIIFSRITQLSEELKNFFDKKSKVLSRIKIRPKRIRF